MLSLISLLRRHLICKDRHSGKNGNNLDYHEFIINVVVHCKLFFLSSHKDQAFHKTAFL